MIQKIFSLLERHARRALLVSLSLVLLVSIVFALSSGDRLHYPDEHEYDRLARSISSGQGYLDPIGRPTAYRPPGWPAVISGVYLIWERPLAVKMLNTIALVGTAWLLSILVGRVVPQARIFPPLLLLGYPLGFHVASTLYPQTLGGVCLVAILLLLDQRSRVTICTAAAGLLFGLLVLAIPAFLLIVPLIVLGMLLANGQRLTEVAGRSALFLLCAAIVVAPWTLRNHRELGGFTPVSTNSGQNLLFGNSENTRPNSGVNVDVSHYRAQVRGLSEIEIDARFKQFAVDWIAGNPGAALELYLRKALNYFNFRNELFVKSQQSRLKDAVMFVSYYPLLAVALLRLGMVRRFGLSPIEIKLYLIYFGNALASAVFFTRLRFRVPFDPLLIAIVAIFLGLWVRSVSSRGAGSSS